MDNIVLPRPPLKPVFFVGASRGGVKALSYLASMLPERFPAPLFMVLHRRRHMQSHKRKNLFMSIVQKNSKMPVVQIEEGALIRSGQIYVPLPGFHFGINDNRIEIIDDSEDDLWCPSLNVVFKSGAREYEARAVCVLLTGGLNDGVEGLQEATRLGGVTITQSPHDAEDPSMPLHALRDDHPAYVLPLAEMPALLCELAGFDYYPEQKEILTKAAIAAENSKRFMREKT